MELKPPVAPFLVRALAVALVSFAGGWFGQSLPFAGTRIALIWLPGGIAIAALHIWGWRMLLPLCLASMSQCLWFGASLATASVMTAGNALGAAFAVEILRRTGFHRAFRRWRDIVFFCVAAPIGMLLTATSGVAIMCATGEFRWSQFGSHWIMWWLADTLGALLAGPLILGLASEAARDFVRRPRELIVWGLLTISVATSVFVWDDNHGISTLPLTFIPLALVVWAALRFGAVGGALAALVVATSAAMGAALGRGPFAQADPIDSVLLLWSYIATGLLLGLMIAALQAERAHAEDEWHEAQSRLALATQAARLGIWDYNAANNTLAWDDRMHEIFQVRREEFSGDLSGWKRTVLPEDAALVTAQLEEAIRTRSDLHTHFRILWPGGERREIEARAIIESAPDGTPRRVVGVNWDVTEQRRDEAQRRELLNRLQQIASQVPGMVFQLKLGTDESITMPYASDGIRELLRVEPEEVKENALCGLANLHPEDALWVKNSLFESARTLTEWHEEFRVLDPDGAERWLLTNSVPQREPDGATIWHGFMTDVTERKRGERELRDKNEELERFAHTISHDLKSPLVTIKTFLGYLELDLIKNDKVRVEQDLGFIRTAAGRMASLIEELLDLSRIGRTANTPTTFTFHDLADEVLRLTAGAISANAVQVKVAEVKATLCGDRPRLVEVWQNLVENAVKFMGGQPEPLLELGAEKSPLGVVFFVRDNGIGIDARHHGKIFGLFEKLDAKSEGTGMGLALVSRIVETCSGSIWLESTEGRGACFKFTLPDAVRMQTGSTNA